MSFSVCSYNIGSSCNDYFQLCKFLKPSLAFSSEEEEKDFRSSYAQAEESASKSLSEIDPDICCLQEVGDRSRQLVQNLEKNGFETIYFEQGVCFDAAILLRKSRFQKIKNHSCNIAITKQFAKDVAIATAVDALTGKSITIISAHAPGFDLTKEVDPSEASDGDVYCQQIATKLGQIGASSIEILGADLNANPEKWKHRFDVFSKKGFELLRTGSATNVNPRDPGYEKREIDFIFTKIAPPNCCQRTVYESSIQVFQSIDWDPKRNGSDHLPVFIDISPKSSRSDRSDSGERKEGAFEKSK